MKDVKKTIIEKAKKVLKSNKHADDVDSMPNDNVTQSQLKEDVHVDVKNADDDVKNVKVSVYPIFMTILMKECTRGVKLNSAVLNALRDVGKDDLTKHQLFDDWKLSGKEPSEFFKDCL